MTPLLILAYCAKKTSFQFALLRHHNAMLCIMHRHTVSPFCDDIIYKWTYLWPGFSLFVRKKSVAPSRRMRGVFRLILDYTLFWGKIFNRKMTRITSFRSSSTSLITHQFLFLITISFEVMTDIVIQREFGEQVLEYSLKHSKISIQIKSAKISYLFGRYLNCSNFKCDIILHKRQYSNTTNPS